MNRATGIPDRLLKGMKSTHIPLQALTRDRTISNVTNINSYAAFQCLAEMSLFVARIVKPCMWYHDAGQTSASQRGTGTTLNIGVLHQPPWGA